jgi:hypothetical protein
MSIDSILIVAAGFVLALFIRHLFTDEPQQTDPCVREGKTRVALEQYLARSRARRITDGLPVWPDAWEHVYILKVYDTCPPDRRHPESERPRIAA